MIPTLPNPLRSFRLYRLRELARRIGAEMIDLNLDPGFMNHYQSCARYFRQNIPTKTAHAGVMQGASVVYGRETISGDAVIGGIYDAEYRGTETRYRYLSPLHTERGFELVTNCTIDRASHLSIVDVGAGSGETLKFFASRLRVPPQQLYGVDVSGVSVSLLKNEGFNGSVGRLESVGYPAGSFDLTFLSYFIDYDLDQASTFKEAIRVTKPGGLIVIEGLFPVRPPAELVAFMRSPAVTRGQKHWEDILLVSEWFKQREFPGVRIRLARIAVGERYVYSRFGFKKLPSYFLAFHLENTRSFVQ